MLLSDLIYFEPIYCFMKMKVVFIFKNPLLLIIPKVYFHGAFVLDFVLYSRRKAGRPRKAAQLSCGGRSPPHHPSWGWHGTQLGSETWMLLAGRRGQHNCSRFKIFAANISPWEQHHSGTVFVVVH